MKLQAYMKMAGLTDQQMAYKIEKNRANVARYRSGKQIPPLDVIARIRDVTDGAVSFDDFLPAEILPSVRKTGG